MEKKCISSIHFGSVYARTHQNNTEKTRVYRTQIYWKSIDKKNSDNGIIESMIIIVKHFVRFGLRLLNYRIHIFHHPYRISNTLMQHLCRNGLIPFSNKADGEDMPTHTEKEREYTATITCIHFEMPTGMTSKKWIMNVPTYILTPSLMENAPKLLIHHIEIHERVKKLS